MTMIRTFTIALLISAVVMVVMGVSMMMASMLRELQDDWLPSDRYLHAVLALIVTGGLCLVFAIVLSTLAYFM